MGVQEGWIDATFTPGLRVSVAEFRRIAYLTNGWDYMRRFQGLWARRSEWTGSNEYQEVPNAGIAGPGTETTIFSTAPSASAAAGEGWDAGVHTLRWRWLDDSTGFVSNPSNELEVTIAADKKLTLTISAAVGSGNIYRPTDLKVTHYVLEATTAAGSTFYEVARIPVLDSAGSFTTSYVAEVTDATLAASPLQWEDDGHDPPPVKRYALAHRGRLFLYGDQVYDVGTVTATANSTTVTGSGTAWTESALGTASAPPTAGRRFLRVGTYEYYEIEAYVSATQLTLKRYYGSTGAESGGASYEIVSGNGLIYFSRENEPESFPPLNWVGLPTSAAGGNVSAAAAFDQSVIFFTARSAYRFSWVSDPGEDGQFYPLPGNRGAFSPRVVVVQESTVFAWDHLGAWVYQGGLPVDVSRPIAALLSSLDLAYTDLWHAVYLPDTRAVRWYVTRSGDTEPKFYFQLDAGRLAQGEIVWTTGYLDVACTESHLGWIDLDSPLYPLLGDENGYLWRGDTGTVDGGGAYHHLTVDTGATSSIVPVTTALPTDGTLRGVAATWVQASGVRETKVVSAHTSTSLILASAFSGAPAQGDTIWLGRIKALLKTRMFYPARGENKRRPRYLRLFWTPLSSVRYLLVRVYATNSASAQTWGVASWRRGDANPIPGGKNSLYATTDVLVDLSDTSGRAEVPLGAEASWCEAYELEVEEPDVALELHMVEVDGVEAPSPE